VTGQLPGKVGGRTHLLELWCGGESITDTKTRNPGKGEEEASTVTVTY